jgi:hypothetical protein
MSAPRSTYRPGAAVHVPVVFVIAIASFHQEFSLHGKICALSPRTDANPRFVHGKSDMR